MKKYIEKGISLVWDVTVILVIGGAVLVALTHIESTIGV